MTRHGNSPIKLLKNEILEDRCDAKTGWKTFLRSKALFRATLIRDGDTESRRETVDPSVLQAALKRAFLGLDDLDLGGDELSAQEHAASPTSSVSAN